MFKKNKVDDEHPVIVAEGPVCVRCETCKEELCEGCSNAKTVPTYVKVIVPLMIGLFFGFALQKSRVFEPSFVIGQMLMEKFDMLQIFIAAVGSSLIFFGLMAIIIPTKFDKGHSVHFERRRGFGIVFTGSLLGGIGMTLSGACPGTLAAQLGALTESSYFTVIGALLGSILYALIEPRLHRFIGIFACDKCGIDKLVKLPYEAVALTLGTLMLGGTIVAGFLTGNISMTNFSLNPMMIAWPLVFCGFMIGLLQIPSVAILGARGLGASAGWVSITGLGLSAFGKTMRDFIGKFPYLRDAVSCSFQVLCLLGIVLGSMGSSLLSNTFMKVAGVGAWRAILGGALIIFGARMANGCTSGHGITGFGHLSTVSLVAIMGLFGGGIASAMIGKYALGLAVQV